MIRNLNAFIAVILRQSYLIQASPSKSTERSCSNFEKQNHNLSSSNEFVR